MSHSFDTYNHGVCEMLTKAQSFQSDGLGEVDQ